MQQHKTRFPYIYPHTNPKLCKCQKQRNAREPKNTILIIQQQQITQTQKLL